MRAKSTEKPGLAQHAPEDSQDMSSERATVVDFLLDSPQDMGFRDTETDVFGTPQGQRQCLGGSACKRKHASTPEPEVEEY